MQSNAAVPIEALRELLKGEKYGDDLEFIPDSAIIPRHKYENIQLALKEYRDRKLFVQSMPAYYHVSLTDHCNLRCALCPTGKMDRGEERGFIDFGLYTDLIDQIARYGVVLWLTGWGEPTFHPKMIQCIHYAADKGLYTYIASNFSRQYSESFFSELVDSGLTRLHIDLDGMTQASYSKYRNGGSVDLVKRNIDHALKANSDNKMSIEVAMIAMRHNEHEIQEFRDFCRERTISPCSVGRLQINPEMALDWLPNEPTLRYNNYLENTSSPIACSRLYFNMTLRHNGHVLPCCLAYGKINEMGNAYDSSLADIWNNVMFQSARGVFTSSSGQCRTLCHLCRNDLGSRTAPHYYDTFALTLPRTTENANA